MLNIIQVAIAVITQLISLIVEVYHAIRNFRRRNRLQLPHRKI